MCTIGGDDTAEIWNESIDCPKVTEGGEISCEIVCDTMIPPLDAGSDTDLEKNGTKLKGRRAEGLFGMMTCIFGLSVFVVPKVFSEPVSK